jgi:hypothetical protein
VKGETVIDDSSRWGQSYKLQEVETTVVTLFKTKQMKGKLGELLCAVAKPLKMCFLGQCFVLGIKFPTQLMKYKPSSFIPGKVNKPPASRFLMPNISTSYMVM